MAIFLVIPSMLSLSLLVFLAAALLFFWAVGAHNRLVRLHAAVGKAFAALDQLLVRQLVWVQSCLPESMRGGPQTTPGELQDEVMASWARLSAASEQFALALAQARTQPVDGAAMDSLVLAQDALDTAWQSAMRDAVPPDTHPSAERLQAKWMQLLHQTLPLNTAFNEAVEIYNAAIAQFPAWLLAKMFGFRMAGSLNRWSKDR
ncbi:hypothetical protein [Ottowia sp.]|uniref:hypothetical protein n=1 Tax=Ottowia sp. TaxID=1898956 RepID=UPI0025E1B7AB|nr:hypothetical protein [Ottowia sp.]MBK6614587.1 hypothetical protein [Ottowia sp.]MBK6745676.1 hypothetical protein [Ottowia sp.]